MLAAAEGGDLAEGGAEDDVALDGVPQLEGDEVHAQEDGATLLGGGGGAFFGVFVALLGVGHVFGTLQGLAAEMRSSQMPHSHVFIPTRDYLSLIIRVELYAKYGKIPSIPKC